MLNAFKLVHNRRPARGRLTASLVVIGCLYACMISSAALGQQNGQDTRSGQQNGQENRPGQPSGTQPATLTSTSRQPFEVPEIAVDPIDPNQPIKPSFMINVSVDKEPEPSGNYVVSPSGAIQVHIAEMLVPVTLKDQTAEQATLTLTTFLKKYIRDPHVQVSLVTVPRPIVVVSGAVQSTGPVAINRYTTLVDVLTNRGWTDNSDLSQVFVTRYETLNGVEKKQMLTLHVDSYMKPEPGKSPDETQNPVLKENDRIFVPFKTLAGNGGITIAGAVKKPVEGMLLRTNPPMTLREAISLAGGTTEKANRKAVSVRRARSPEIIVDLDKADLNDPENNIVLQPDDSIYIEELPDGAFVNVVGGVFKSGKIPYVPHMTLTKAILEAGGIAPYAKDKKGYVVRHLGDDPSQTKTITFNWYAILNSKAPDIEILPEDSVWIAPGTPPNQPFNLAQLLTTLAIYHP